MTKEAKLKMSLNARRPMLGKSGSAHSTWKEVKSTQLEADKRWREKNPERWKELCKLATHARRAIDKIDSKAWQDKVISLGSVCQGCRRGDVVLTIDHIVPVSKGGTNHITNLQPLCRSCNSSKGVMAEHEFASKSML